MLNQRTTKLRRGTTPARCEMSFWAWQGYVDFSEGRGFSPAYDTLPRNNQRNYERGRQVAATMKGMVDSLPKWRKSERMDSVLRRALNWSQVMDLSDDIRPLFYKR